MKRPEMIRRIEAWVKLHADLMEQYHALQALTGADPDCALFKPIFTLWDSYTIALSELIGDEDEWLQWYATECEMGNKPKNVLIPGDTKQYRVKTIQQLARVIMMHN